MKRRSLLQTAAVYTAVSLLGTSTSARSEDTEASIRDDWFRELFSSRRSSDDRLLFGRFKDAHYFLLAPISWEPNNDLASKYKSVTVPTGFVSDLASVPSAFYRILPPDAEYAYAAIIHDYLYWIQDRPRVVADDIFRMAMQDFAVSSGRSRLLYEAVRKFGQHAWDENARLRRNGEQRILKNFPPNARITWDEWRANPEAFR